MVLFGYQISIAAKHALLLLLLWFGTQSLFFLLPRLKKSQVSPAPAFFILKC